MAVSRVQSATGSYNQADGNPTSVAATWGSATTAGNTLVAVVGISLVAGGSSTYSTPSGWGSSVARIDLTSNCGVEIWVIENAASRSGSETFSIASAARDSTLTLIELTPCTVDTVGADSTGTSTNPSTGTAAPSANLSVYRLGALANRNNSTQSSPTNSFVEFAEVMSPNATAGNRVNVSCCQKIETSSASTSCSTTLGTSRPWAAVQIIFKETVAGQNATITPATETDSAPALARTKSRTHAVTSETDAAVSLARAKSRGLAVTTEADSATPLGRLKARLLTVATEAGAAVTLGRTKSRSLTPAAETNTAVTLTGGLVDGTIDATITPAPESDTAVPLGRTKSRTLTPALEAGGAPAPSRIKSRTLTPAAEADAVAPLSRTKIRGLVAAAESATAHLLSRLKSRTLAPAPEVDTAVPLAMPDEPDAMVAAAVLAAPDWAAELVPAEQTARLAPADWAATLSA